MEVKSIEEIISALNRAQVRYLVVGGLAVNAHGFERMTRDIDLVIQLTPDNCLRAVHSLIEIGYQLSIPEQPENFASSERREVWRREKNMIVLKLWSDLHRRTPIDIFIYEPFPFDEEYSRSLSLEVADGLIARFVSLETLLAMKREAGRSQDIQDIAELERSRRVTHEMASS